MYYPTNITDNIPLMWRNMIMWWSLLLAIALLLAKENPEVTQNKQENEDLFINAEEEGFF